METYGGDGSATFYATGFGRNDVQQTPCAYMGNAMSPSQYAEMGQAWKHTWLDPVFDPVNASNGAGFTVGGLIELYSDFHRGGSLDAQPYANGDQLQKATYGNFAFGVFFAAAGWSLDDALTAASIYGYKQRIVNRAYRGRSLDPKYSGIPVENVQDITAGYPAQLSGAACR